MIFISDKIKFLLIYTVLAFLFALFVKWGWTAGEKQAQGRLIVVQAKEAGKALENFYSDNKRFPTADEFARPEIMSNYLNHLLSGTDIQTSKCPQIFIYQRPLPEQYNLNFCLPVSTDSFKTGWNTFSIQK